jgi:hypothetical protein
MCIACEFLINNNPVIIDDIIHDHYDNSHPNDDYTIIISCNNIRKLPRFILNDTKLDFNIQIINCPNLQEIRGLSNLCSLSIKNCQRLRIIDDLHIINRVEILSTPNLSVLSNFDTIGILSIEWSNKLIYRNLTKFQYIEICNENRDCGSLLLRNVPSNYDDDIEYFINDDVSLIITNYISSVYERKNNVLYQGDVNLNDIAVEG